MAMVGVQKEGERLVWVPSKGQVLLWERLKFSGLQKEGE